jgi:hypothetical protein
VRSQAHVSLRNLPGRPVRDHDLARSSPTLLTWFTDASSRDLQHHHSGTPRPSRASTPSGPIPAPASGAMGRQDRARAVQRFHGRAEGSLYGEDTGPIWMSAPAPKILPDCPSDPARTDRPLGHWSTSGLRRPETFDFFPDRCAPRGSPETAGRVPHRGDMSNGALNAHSASEPAAKSTARFRRSAWRPVDSRTRPGAT